MKGVPTKTSIEPHLLVWVSQEVESFTGHGTGPAWQDSFLALLSDTSYRIEHVQLAGKPTTEQTRLLAEAGVVMSSAVEVSEKLVRATIDRRKIWTLVQSHPTESVEVASDDGFQRIQQALAYSQKLLVFTEEARSAIEVCFIEATANVIVLPPPAGHEKPSFIDEVERLREPALCINVNSFEAYGISALADYVRHAKSKYQPLPLFLLGDPERLDELKTQPELRPLLSIPGAQTVQNTTANIASLALQFRLIGVLFAPEPGTEITTRQTYFWCIDHNLEILAQRGSWPPEPEAPIIGFWDPSTIVSDLERSLTATPRQKSPNASTGKVLEKQLNHFFPDYQNPPRAATKTRVLLVGADYKFAGDYVEALAQRDDIELKVDLWDNNSTPQPEKSIPLMEWADVVLCEFSSFNAIWYSHNLPRPKKLYVHLHGFELLEKWIVRLNFARVDKMIFASEFYRQKAISKMRWPASKTGVISNSIHGLDLLRPKLPESRFRLGMVGFVPSLKRLDRALDLLEMLIAEDDRYVLYLRGHKPWNYLWEWRRPLHRDTYLGSFERIRTNDALRDAVVFEPFGADMGNWFRHIGWMLSPSTRETFHLSPVEGMASGAIPLVWKREGSEEIFPEKFNFDSTEEIADFILKTNETPHSFEDLSLNSVSFSERYSALKIRSEWIGLLLNGSGEHSEMDERDATHAILSTSEQESLESLRQLDSLQQYGNAQSLLNTLSLHPWQLEEPDRRMLARVRGIPLLRQRLHTLCPSAAPKNQLKKADRYIDISPQGVASIRFREGINTGPGLTSDLRLSSLVDNLNLDFDRWVSQLWALILRNQATEVNIRATGIHALAGVVAAKRAGVYSTWDLSEQEETQQRLARAQMNPNGLPDYDLITLFTGISADHLRGISAPLFYSERPVEFQIAPAQSRRPPQVCTIGSFTSFDLTGVQQRSLNHASWKDDLDAGVPDALLISAEELSFGLRPDSSITRNIESIQPVLDYAHQGQIPVGFIQVDAQNSLEEHLPLVRRSHAAIIPDVSSLGRLFDKQILKTQVTHAWSYSLHQGDAVRLLMRLLRLSFS